MLFTNLVAGLSRFLTDSPGTTPPPAIGVSIEGGSFGPSLLELARFLTEPAVVVPLRCSPYKQPACDLIWQALRLTGSDSPAAPAASAEPSAGALDRALAGAGQEGPAAEALAWYLHERCGEGPVILLIEDLHWAGAHEVRFLRNFLQTEAGSRAALVFSYAEQTRRRHFRLFTSQLSGRQVLTLHHSAAACHGEAPEVLSPSQATALIATRLYGGFLPLRCLSRLIGAGPDGAAARIPGLRHLRLQGEEIITFRDGTWTARAQKLAAANPALTQIIAAKLGRAETGPGAPAAVHRLAYLASVSGDLPQVLGALQALLGTERAADRHLLMRVLRRLRSLAPCPQEAGLAALAEGGLGLARLFSRRGRPALLERRLLRAHARLESPAHRWVLRKRLANRLARSRNPEEHARAKAHLLAALQEIGGVTARSERELAASALRSELAKLCYRSGQFPQGLRHELLAVRRLESLLGEGYGSPALQERLVAACVRMGTIYRKQLRQHARAREYYNRALYYAMGTEQPTDVYRVLKYLALAAMDAGNFREALGHWTQAEFSLIDGAGSWSVPREWEREKAELHRRLAEVHLRLGRLCDAAEQYTMLVNHFQHRLPAAVVETFQANVGLCHSHSIS